MFLCVRLPALGVPDRLTGAVLKLTLPRFSRVLIVAAIRRGERVRPCEAGGVCCRYRGMLSQLSGLRIERVDTEPEVL